MSLRAFCAIYLMGFCRFVGGETHERGHKVCKAYGFDLIKAKFGDESYWLCLKRKAIGSSLTTHNSVLLLDQDEVKSFDLSDITMAYGFPLNDPDMGSAEGYIGDDHHFYGILHLGNRTLHADPYGIDHPKRYFGAFDEDAINFPRLRRDQKQVHPLVSEAIDSVLESRIKTIMKRVPLFPFQIEDPPRLPGVARARICDLLLMADKEFYEKDANKSLTQAVRRMLHAVTQADIIFRNADFDEDGIPDNIGFSVKYIVVLTSEETNDRVFGDLLKDKAVDGREYLMRFARIRRLSEVCLGVAFSGRAFFNRTLGLSFTSLGGGLGGAAGGLCDRRAFGKSFNTLAIAHATSDEKGRVPERIAALTLAHEMGHSFGAHHDDNFPNAECRGYLMGSQSTTADEVKHFEFSLCSKRLISATLSSMSYCLSIEDRPYCGNGIVESGEACDCGLPYRCRQKDPCCTPRAGGAQLYDDGALHKEGCSVAPAASCHPSQGLCCNSNCQFSDLTSSGIECSAMETECSCRSAQCRCGLGGRCLRDGSCHAAECASLDLRECHCTHRGPGGLLNKMKMCGVCCEVPAEAGQEAGKCVGAEKAAMYTIRKHSTLPMYWPDVTYSGPNVSVQLCDTSFCTVSYLRAWRNGDVCVSKNTVGYCSKGVCKPEPKAPRPNAYPDTMNVRMQSQISSIHKSNGTSSETLSSILLSTLIFIILILK